MSDVTCRELTGGDALEHADPLVRCPVRELGGATVAVNPVIDNLSPIGPSVGTQAPVHIEFSLSPASGVILRFIVWVEFAGGGTEMIWDGDRFTADYTGRSVKADLGGGVMSFDVIRNGGWPRSPRVFAHANTDRGGMTVA